MTYQSELARSFPTGVTILRVLGIARWLAWGRMVAVVAFSGDAVRQPLVAWLSVAAGLALATISTWWMRSSPGMLLTPGFVIAEGAYALALGRRNRWNAMIVEPLRGRLDDREADQLVAALGVGWGTEAAIALVDVAGLDAETAKRTMLQTCHWILAGAIADAAQRRTTT